MEQRGGEDQAGRTGCETMPASLHGGKVVSKVVSTYLHKRGINRVQLSTQILPTKGRYLMRYIEMIVTFVDRKFLLYERKYE